MILFSPIGVFPVDDLTTMSESEMAGLLDRLKFWEGIKVYENVTVGDLMAAMRAAQAKDAAAIRAAVTTIAQHAGFEMEADEIDDIVEEVLQRDTKGIVYESCDATMKFLVKHGGYVPKTPATGDGFQITEADEILDTRTMTAAQSLEWLGRRREQVKEGCKLRIVRRVIKNRSPELYAILTGEMSAEGLSNLTPEQIKRIVDVMRTVSKILTYGSILAGPYAPLVLIVANAINLLIARYDALHPTEAGVEVNSDRGLDFSDFVPEPSLAA